MSNDRGLGAIALLVLCLSLGCAGAPVSANTDHSGAGSTSAEDAPRTGERAENPPDAGDGRPVTVFAIQGNRLALLGCVGEDHQWTVGGKCQAEPPTAILETERGRFVSHPDGHARVESAASWCEPNDAGERFPGWMLSQHLPPDFVVVPAIENLAPEQVPALSKTDALEISFVAELEVHSSWLVVERYKESMAFAVYRVEPGTNFAQRVLQLGCGPAGWWREVGSAP